MRAQARSGDITGAEASAKHIGVPILQPDAQAEIALAKARAGNLSSASAMLSAATTESQIQQAQDLARALSGPVLAGDPAARAILDKLLATVPERERRRADWYGHLLALRPVTRARSGQVAEALATVDTIAYTRTQIWVLRNAAIQQAKAGQAEAARQSLTRARALLKAAADAPEEIQGDLGLARGRLAVTQARIGDFAGAKATVAEAKPSAEEHSDEPGNWLASIAAIQAGAGDLGGAKATLRAIQSVDAQASALCGIALARLRAGDRTGAQKDWEIVHAQMKAAKAHDRILMGETISQAAVLQAKLGDIDGAAALALEMQPDGDKREMSWALADVAKVICRQQGKEAARRWVSHQPVSLATQARLLIQLGEAALNPEPTLYLASDDEW